MLEMESLFYGAYQVVAEEIGMDIDIQRYVSEEETAREWIKPLQKI